MPVPADFGRFSVETQEDDEGSTLSFYRRALAERRRLQTGEMLTWLSPVPPTVGGRRHCFLGQSCRADGSG